MTLASIDLQVVAGLVAAIISVSGAVLLAKGLIVAAEAPFRRYLIHLGLPRDVLKGQIDPDPGSKYSGKQLIVFGLAMQCLTVVVVAAYWIVDAAT